MWSAGCIMYCMLIGNLPFDGDKDTEIFVKIRKVILSFNEKSMQRRSRECIDILKKTLYKTPGSRITCQDAIQHKWIIDNGVELEDIEDRYPRHFPPYLKGLVEQVVK
mmetsp:Transcript_12553/g.21137  ORF Transcript_12553/g.21137 Transcript_12553/m.21137 type:complete len:108 (+) Transcript_12553:627-950(+)